MIPYNKLNNKILPNYEEKLKPYVEVIQEYEKNIQVNDDI